MALTGTPEHCLHPSRVAYASRYMHGCTRTQGDSVQEIPLCVGMWLYRFFMAQAPGRSNKRHSNSNTLDLPQFLTTAQVCEVTGLSLKTITRRIHDGSLPAKRLGPRVFRIDRAALLEWLGAA